jgi:drug/metabolite transporter (DMT)-like permease
VLGVLGASQVAGLVLLVVVVAARGQGPPSAADLLPAVLGSIGGTVALGAFYRALSIGTMSIVAPISATGVAIPVFVGLTSGDRPGALQAIGMALACGGVVLASREPPAAGAEDRRTGRTAVLLALVAAVGFGSFFAGIDRAEQTADVAWVLFCTRVADVALLVIATAVVRPRFPAAPGTIAAIAAIGFFDLLANALFVLATGRGLLSVVGVLGSLYPAVTVLLARSVLHERLSHTQNLGVVITLAGVVALAAG